MPDYDAAMAILIEVAVSTLADAHAAHAGGAGRLELSAALELGGLTPSLGTLHLIRESVPLPVIAMLRPRPGGFVYSATEFLTIQRDADLLLAHGASGLAFGFLHADRTIDVLRTREVLRQVGSACQTVFHRAFDLTTDPIAAVDSLIDCGITRILTSGQQSGAPAGAALIRSLIRHAGGRIEILPGCGISPGNAAALVRQTSAAQLHGSFSEKLNDDAEQVCQGNYQATSARLVATTRAALTGPAVTPEAGFG
jgi:copper homeostasis protein